METINRSIYNQCQKTIQNNIHHYYYRIDMHFYYLFRHKRHSIILFYDNI